MMLIPRRNDFDLFDDMFNEPFFKREENKLMKTDIKDKGNHYIIDLDLPGYEKENIQIEVEDGYLTVHATMNVDNKEEEDGKFLRRERYMGECSRSFYVGDSVTPEDIKASFKNGTLSLEVPKQEPEKEKAEKKYVQIEG